MRLPRIVVLLMLLVFTWSCKKDDDNSIEVVPPRPPAEVKTENDAEIQAFLKTHFYNYEEFANPPADFDFRIKIDTLAGDNADKTPLIDQVEMDKVSVPTKFLGLDEEGSTDQILYYLIARQGVGGSPTVADSTFLKYEGSLLNGKLFDAIPTYSWQHLGSTIRGYSQGLTHFKVGSEIVVNPDGTTDISDAGIGFIIIPSALGYYDVARPNIPAYSNIMFKMDVGLYVKDTDYDGDGIPSILEDLNGNGYLNDDNTDFEDENKTYPYTLTPNFMDRDDDGDGVLTRDEIEIDSEGNITFPDRDGDGIPDYLDKDTK